MKARTRVHSDSQRQIGDLVKELERVVMRLEAKAAARRGAWSRPKLVGLPGGKERDGA